MEEIWKDIKGYEGKYKVSNLGNVKSLNYCNTNTSKILSGAIMPNGYKKICLYKNGKQKNFLVHRLVADAFIPNPNNLPQINHKDENRANNNVSNLEWCTAKYNSNYGNHKIKLSDKIKGKFKGEKNPMYGIKGKNNPSSKKVIQYSLNGEFIKKWDCVREAGEELNIFPQHISRVCRGKRKSAKGYIWRYEGGKKNGD